MRVCRRAACRGIPEMSITSASDCASVSPLPSGGAWSRSRMSWITAQRSSHPAPSSSTSLLVVLACPGACGGSSCLPRLAARKKHAPVSGGARVYGPPGMCVRVRVTDLSSHLQNGCHRPSDEGRGVKHASVMVTEGIGTTCNHSWLTLGVVDFPLGPPRGRSGPSRRPSGLSSQLKIRRQDELQLYRSVPSCLE